LEFTLNHQQERLYFELAEAHPDLCDVAAGQPTSCCTPSGTPSARAWARQGADAFTIMKLMGHSTVMVSQRYVHPSPEAMERAVSRMAKEQVF
jgi:integrase